MDSAKHLIRMAEDELTEYSTEARKLEQLRRKFNFAVPYPRQQTVRSQKPWTIAGVQTARQEAAAP